MLYIVLHSFILVLDYIKLYLKYIMLYYIISHYMTAH